jgi:hypothetical protein
VSHLGDACFSEHSDWYAVSNAKPKERRLNGISDMLTLLEALAQLAHEKSILGWRLREVIATTREHSSFLSLKWDFPDEYYFYLIRSYHDDIDRAYRPAGVSDREWFGPPPDKVAIMAPTEADIFCAGLLLGAENEKHDGKIVFRLSTQEN